MINVYLCIICICIVPGCSGGFTGYDEGQWKKAADFLLEGYDPAAEPCENFTKFACGKWYQKQQLQSQVEVQAAKIFELGVKAVLKVNETDHKTPSYKKSVKFFLDYCLKNATDTTVADIYRQISTVLGTPPLITGNEDNKLLNKSIWYLMGVVQREFPKMSKLFKVTVQPAYIIEGVKVAALHFLPDYQVMERLDKQNFKDKIGQLASVLNLNLSRDQVEKDAEDLTRLELALAKLLNNSQLAATVAQISNFYLENRWNISNLYLANNLTKTFPNISWDDFFHGLFTPSQWKKFNASETIVAFEDTDFFMEIGEILQQFDKKSILNYVFLNAIEQSANVLVNNANCISYMFECFSSALTRMIFEDQGYDLLEWRADVQLIAETVFSAARYLFAGANWLDDSEKIKLISKVSQIRIFSGIPNWITNDTEVDRRTVAIDKSLPVMRNVFKILKGNFERYLNIIVGIDDPNMESEPILELNANYARFQILMYLGYELPPWYHPKYPLAVKYGNLGFVVAHELFHAFDVGHITEEPRFVKSWLSECTLKQYHQRVACVKKQYSSYCSKQQNQCISGEKTITENMADLDGLKVSYMAYRFATMTAGKDNPLPGLTALDNDQLFFLTTGRVHCASNGDMETWFAAPESHAPQMARMEIPLRNFDAFSKAFKCPAGSRYDGARSCPLWGDFTGVEGIDL